MLQRVDRIVLAVRNRRAAEQTFAAILGAETVRDDRNRLLGVHRLVVQAGATEIDLLEPSDAGPVQDHLSRWGEGLFAAGFAVADLAAAGRHLSQQGVHSQEEAGQLHIAPDQTCGLRVVLSPSAAPRPPAGLIKCLYEVTNVVTDWRRAAARYAAIFGLSPEKFHPLTSDEFGYTGTLLLFNPPAQLDRIELAQIIEPEKAMGRFAAKRGETAYMCYAETDDVGAIVARLERRGARWAGSTDTPAGANIFVHPSGLHGLLMGVSHTNLAWLWSGRPELVQARS